MSLIETKIKALIGTQYSPFGKELSSENDSDLCWKFCREIMGYYCIELSKFPHQCLERTDKIKIPCIVLFRVDINWHSGVLWPDGLHFIHIRWEDTLQNEVSKKSCYRVRLEKLTRWPWINILEGYYINV